uniref:Uncharacterized protein n=1 Tax=Candidatus Kentrum sp. LFY TaxID=2126342 RepID=A0A450WIE5_9GAMM|nr:MAG: hypothetical protein BECKLFY1418C_GA0070996_10265 [Candidatus Kentron sp. LFY]
MNYEKSEAIDRLYNLKKGVDDLLDKIDHFNKDYHFDKDYFKKKLSAMKQDLMNILFLCSMDQDSHSPHSDTNEKENINEESENEESENEELGNRGFEAP